MFFPLTSTATTSVISICRWRSNEPLIASVIVKAVFTAHRTLISASSCYSFSSIVGSWQMFSPLTPTATTSVIFRSRSNWNESPMSMALPKGWLSSSIIASLQKFYFSTATTSTIFILWRSNELPMSMVLVEAVFTARSKPSDGSSRAVTSPSCPKVYD